VEQTVPLDFDGYALGGVSVGEPKEIMYEITDSITPLLPVNKPRYLMGVGTPEDIVFGVSCGIDMFDCVIPTRCARHGLLFTNSEKIVIKNSAGGNVMIRLTKRAIVTPVKIIPGHIYVIFMLPERYWLWY